DRVQDCMPAFPRGVREAVEQLCVENCAVPAWQLDDVRRALDKVAQAFALAGAQAVRVAAAGTRKRLRSPKAIAARQESRQETGQEMRQETRQEKFAAGAYVARAADATPRPSRHHAQGSQAERDHAALVRRLEEAQRRREEGT